MIPTASRPGLRIAAHKDRPLLHIDQLALIALKVECSVNRIEISRRARAQQERRHGQNREIENGFHASPPANEDTKPRTRSKHGEKPPFLGRQSEGDLRTQQIEFGKTDDHADQTDYSSVYNKKDNIYHSKIDPHRRHMAALSRPRRRHALLCNEGQAALNGQQPCQMLSPSSPWII
jgi:hypothetical protein